MAHVLQTEVQRWMESIGFQANLDAEKPNYILSISALVDPSDIVKTVAFEHRDWDTLDDLTMITPECAELFYRLAHKKES